MWLKHTTSPAYGIVFWRTNSINEFNASIAKYTYAVLVYEYCPLKDTLLYLYQH